jgi:hypothetical protein
MGTNENLLAKVESRKVEIGKWKLEIEEWVIATSFLI